MIDNWQKEEYNIANKIVANIHNMNNSNNFDAISVDFANLVSFS